MELSSKTWSAAFRKEPKYIVVQDTFNLVRMESEVSWGIYTISSNITNALYKYNRLYLKLQGILAISNLKQEENMKGVVLQSWWQVSFFLIW